MTTLDATPLSELTTLGIGGPARVLVEATSEAELVAEVRGARSHGDPLLVLGGGSNLVVADAGFDGRVVAVRTRGVVESPRGEEVVLRVAAGEPWDDLVARCVAQGLTGLECLSGIPGRVGATPIQNVGAYGQQVEDTLVAVRAWDLLRDHEVRLEPADLALGYRDSALKSRWPGRFVVLEVVFRLRRGPPVPTDYPGLQVALDRAPPELPALARIRHAVLAVRRSKSMVHDPADRDSHSAGSFFTNPVVPPEQAAEVRRRAGDQLPAWEVEGGTKLAAAWLIEQAGFTRGLARGRVGLSTQHALALINRGGATAVELVDLAREIRDGVQARFGVTLRPEPVFVGFPSHPLGG